MWKKLSEGDYFSDKVPISKNLRLFADAQARFVDNVVPTMKMSPIEFEVYFDGLVKAKGLSLKLGKGEI